MLPKHSKRARERKQKQQIPFIILTCIWWLLIILTIFFIDPINIKDIGIKGLYLPFLLLVFLAISFSIYLISSNSVRSLVWALASIVFLTLRFYSLGHIVNALLILGLLIVFEYMRYINKPPAIKPEV